MESKKETLERVKKESINFKGFISEKEIYISEAYRIERNKQEAPSDEYIEDEHYPFVDFDRGIRFNFKAGAKWMRDHFTNISK
jgi:hypothetical protein